MPEIHDRSIANRTADRTADRTPEVDIAAEGAALGQARAALLQLLLNKVVDLDNPPPHGQILKIGKERMLIIVNPMQTIRREDAEGRTELYIQADRFSSIQGVIDWMKSQERLLGRQYASLSPKYCLVCTSEGVTDEEADVASDNKIKVYQQLAEGKSIIDWAIERENNRREYQRQLELRESEENRRRSKPFALRACPVVDSTPDGNYAATQGQNRDRAEGDYWKWFRAEVEVYRNQIVDQALRERFTQEKGVDPENTEEREAEFSKWKEAKLQEWFMERHPVLRTKQQ